MALKLLSLPREIGKHPESGEPITAGLGRYGPFVRHEKTYASLEAGERGVRHRIEPGGDADRRENRQGAERTPVRRRSGKTAGRASDAGGVAVKSGRYGAYVTSGGVNATIPSDKTQDTITLSEAIALIDERVAKGGGKPKRGGKKAAKKADKPAKPAKMRSTPSRKPAQEGGGEEIRRKAEIGSRQQGTRAGDGRRQDIAGQTRPRFQNGGEKAPARPGDNVAKQREGGFRPGTPSSPSSARIRKRSGTREIAREFGLKNADRAELKRILRELADQGAIQKRGKKIREPAALPATVLADISGRDGDGELIATPAEWNGGRKRGTAENPHSCSQARAAGHRGRCRRPRAAQNREARGT